MNCFTCGKPLQELDIQLTDEEVEDKLFIVNKEEVCHHALRKDAVNLTEFRDGQVYEYYKAAFDGLAEVRFLTVMWDKKVREKYNLVGDFDFINGKLYTYTHE